MVSHDELGPEKILEVYDSKACMALWLLIILLFALAKEALG
jgi:hypothetical protein